MSQPAAPPDAAWRSWPPGAKQALRDRLTERLRPHWRSLARAEQLSPDGPWQTLLLRGGRGSGKTWAGAHILAELIEQDPARDTEGPGQWAVIAPTYGDARDTCIEGESGLLAALGTTRTQVEAGRSSKVKTWNRSMGEMVLADGSVVFADGADDGALRVQGKNLRGAWCDEIGLWRRWEQAWHESLGFALRKGQARRVATGTPKRIMPARRLLRELLDDPDVIDRRLRTADNRANLSDSFWTRVQRTAGSELGRQELEGELLEDVEGALWRREWITRGTLSLNFMRRRVVGLDPSDGTGEGAEQGLAVCGAGTDGLLYVIASEGLRGSPMEYLKHAITMARDHGATIIVEKNHGGQYLVGLLEQAMGELSVRAPYRVVTASAGKQTRAEPVAMLYEQGKVRHFEAFPDLEDQLTGWTGDGPSPDRLDALVWAMTELIGYAQPAGDNGEGAVPYSTARDQRGVQGAVDWK